MFGTERVGREEGANFMLTRAAWASLSSGESQPTRLRGSQSYWCGHCLPFRQIRLGGRARLKRVADSKPRPRVEPSEETSAGPRSDASGSRGAFAGSARTASLRQRPPITDPCNTDALSGVRGLQVGAGITVKHRGMPKDAPPRHPKPTMRVIAKEFLILSYAYANSRRRGRRRRTRNIEGPPGASCVLGSAVGVR
ncbi:hypothetical protein C8Q79DRAFT_693623 [Trametes meyenii]|nr:hypothetical protein C8Q79DRAFT_693623 [Trametes meyenii]